MDFNNTEITFSYKSDKELKKTYFVLKLVSIRALNIIASKLLPSLIRFKWVKKLLKETVFNQFCAAEHINQTTSVVDRLNKYGIKSILDYSAEGVKSEDNFEKNCVEVLKVIALAAKKPEIPFAVIKLTAIADIDLLNKLQENENQLSENEQSKLSKAKERLERLCKLAAEKEVRFFIDAEESWIQAVIDTWALEMMRKYNVNNPVIYNTIQAYRVDSVLSINKTVEIARKEGFYLGLKIVRGAYMEKERERAKEKGYASPINETKELTDKEFDDAIKTCIKHYDIVSFCCATHNERSTEKTIELMKESKLSVLDEKIYFGQLYGMSDHISFNLAHNNYNVVKYLPYGPIEEVMPYLIRRAEENTSIAGQMGRELKLVYKEIKRRAI